MGGWNEKSGRLLIEYNDAPGLAKCLEPAKPSVRHCAKPAVLRWRP